ncbi:hypothetical protein SAMN00017477_0708 [Peptoniphilus asaccharolyticus DSM 20463]|uniref:Uncharacterized protein n=1 Tax=Peptoniphilus asaccharolyticus DSM 20463 TaxID=573058 RepID=A0A1W1UUS5_PEPAS|nr:hypothetical protein [Peptoniphilus asaccharolyticus]MBL7575208.1 hypothetical protein [Peptoniphilus asaccharolyticus]SMB84823.1 hypothetical protein SAMN00017477_0708 [Peptoniphilus asaccharolyticus DSM 20463]
MEERYIKLAYEKIHTSDIESIREIDGIKYALPKSTNVFFGTDNIVGDKFKVNDEKPEAKEISNQIYFKTNSNNLKFEIDYTQRLDLIQQITANAIVRIIINKATNLKIDDYYISPVDNQIIIDSNDISFMQIEQIESTANHLILSNLSTNNTGSILMVRGYGSVESVGPVCERIGELGLLKIKSASRKNGKISIHIVSGKRAIDDYFEKSKIVENLQSILNVNQSEILKKVKEIKLGKVSRESRPSEMIYSDSNKLNPLSENNTKNTEEANESHNIVVEPLISKNEPVETEIDEEINTKNSEEESSKPSVAKEIATKNNPEVETTPSAEKIVTEENSNIENKEIVNEEDVVSEKQEEKIVEHTAQVINLVEQANKSKATNPLDKLSEEALKITKFATDVDGIHFIYKVFRNKSVPEVIKHAKEISNLPDYISILGFPIGDISNFYVVRSKNLNVDLKNILEKINPKLFLKSSGNMYEVEGSVHTQNLATVMESFLLNIKN